MGDRTVATDTSLVRGDHPTAALIYTNMVDEMFANGYNGASLRRIAKSSGVTMATLYYHFPAKEAILLEIMTRTLSDLDVVVRQAKDSRNSSAESLRAMVEAHIEFHIARRKEAWVTDVEFKVLTGKARETIKGMRDQYEGLFLATVAGGIKSGHFADVQIGIVTKAILTLCTAVAQWFRPDGPLSAETVSSEYIQFIFRALTPTLTERAS